MFSLRRILFLMAALVFIAGCMKEERVYDMQEKEVSLRIGYMSEQRFDQRYAELLSIKFPKLSYEIIPTSPFILGELTAQEWAKKNAVDLIFLTPEQSLSLKDDGLLLELDSFIKRDSFPLDSLVPSAVDLMKQYGDGKFYGLSPNFYGRALVYNKRLFDQLHVDYPTDQMSWDDIILLANKFPQGLTLTTSMANWLLDIGHTMDLQAYDSQTERVTLNSPSWAKIFNSVKDSLQNKTITFDDINHNPFLSGEYAMSVLTSEELKQLEMASEQDTAFDWKLVTMPVNPSQPDMTQYFRIPDLISIPTSSTHVDAAWELAKHLMSDQVAEWEYRSNYGFSSLKAFVTISQHERNMEAFYKLDASPSNPIIPGTLYMLLDESVVQMLKGERSVEDILASTDISLPLDSGDGS